MTSPSLLPASLSPYAQSTGRFASGAAKFKAAESPLHPKFGSAAAKKTLIESNHSLINKRRSAISKLFIPDSLRPLRIIELALDFLALTKAPFTLGLSLLLMLPFAWTKYKRLTAAGEPPVKAHQQTTAAAPGATDTLSPACVSVAHPGGGVVDGHPVTENVAGNGQTAYQQRDPLGWILGLDRDDPLPYMPEGAWDALNDSALPPAEGHSPEPPPFHEGESGLH